MLRQQMTSADYLAHLRAHEAALRAFAAARHAFHMRQINEEQYSDARKAMSRADAAFDVALSRELCR